MIAKLVTVLDRGTRINVLAVKTKGSNESETQVLEQAGYGEFTVFVTNLESQETKLDPFKWNDITLKTVHQFLVKNFENIESAVTIDVEYVRGEVEVPKEGSLLVR